MGRCGWAWPDVWPASRRPVAVSLSPAQKALLISILAGVVAWSLVTIGARTSQPAMPDQVIFQPPPGQPKMLLVGVAGSVARPGLYWLPEGSTVADAIRAAGGPTFTADLSRLNLGRRVRNNEMINVIAKPRPPEYHPPAGVNTHRVSTARIVGHGPAPKPSRKPSQGSSQAGHLSSTAPPYRVNINTALPQQLEGLPGIGPALARRIVEYRNLHGPFRSLQDLQQVKGIGPKKATQIAPYIEF